MTNENERRILFILQAVRNEIHRILSSGMGMDDEEEIVIRLVSVLRQYFRTDDSILFRKDVRNRVEDMIRDI